MLHTNNTHSISSVVWANLIDLDLAVVHTRLVYGHNGALRENAREISLVAFFAQ